MPRLSDRRRLRHDLRGEGQRGQGRAGHGLPPDPAAVRPRPEAHRHRQVPELGKPDHLSRPGHRAAADGPQAGPLHRHAARPRDGARALPRPGQVPQPGGRAGPAVPQPVGPGRRRVGGQRQACRTPPVQLRVGPRRLFGQ